MPSDCERLQRLIDASGLSQVRFARDVLGRDVKTLRNWLNGEGMPATARDWLSRVARVDSDPERVSIEVLRP
jgi:DNA-binding transcriptional regulator YiaG